MRDFSKDDWRERSRMQGRSLAAAWCELFGAIQWQLFVTLTFDPKKVYPVDAVLASKEAFWWCCQLGRLVRRPVGWLYAVERGRHGSWHAHALLVGMPADIGPAPAAMWRQRNGIFHVRLVDDTGREVVYTTKDAALSGDVSFSDTLPRYRKMVSTGTRVSLC